jgi:cell wall-associated NlpC family hydrolase
MATERVFDNRTTKRASELIGAVDLGLSQFDEDIKLPSGQYGFNAVIETENTRITNENIDFEYDIPFDDDIVPNEATIVIYNLSNATVSNLKKGNELTITAGYGTDMGVILRGKISAVKTYHEECDKITKIYVLDNFDYTDGSVVEKTFEAGTTASGILKSLIEQVGLPIGVFKVQRDHTYTSTTTVKGSIAENIKTYSDVCGVSVWVNKQRIYCRPIWDGDNIHFTITAETGMIDSPEPFEEESTSEEYKDAVTGYNITMLAQHRMTTAAIVEVESKDYKGTFRVCSGTHSYDGLSATTEIKCIENITTEIVQTEDASAVSENSTGTSNGAVDAAVLWAINIANDDSYKYIWGGWGRSNGGYDCGHFVICAYEQAGIPLRSSGATYTENLKSVAIKCGFEDVTSSCDLSTGSGMKKGDILLNEIHHAALVMVDGGTTVEARGKDYGIVANVPYRSYPWDCVLRYSKADDVSSTESSSAGEGWVTGHMATTYGWDGDDNSICGWNGLNYNRIGGCHVAIPFYCVKQASCYNSRYAKADYPELADGYGVILEVRSPDTGKSILAITADSGNFGAHNTYNHDTALDLPPNTYTALGVGRTKCAIEYRRTGKSLRSWNGTQTEIDNA